MSNENMTKVAQQIIDARAKASPGTWSKGESEDWSDDDRIEVNGPDYLNVAAFKVEDAEFIIWSANQASYVAQDYIRLQSENAELKKALDMHRVAMSEVVNMGRKEFEATDHVDVLFHAMNETDAMLAKYDSGSSK